LKSSLSGEYLSLLIALQQNPLATIEELAKRTNTSRPTIAKRLNELSTKKKQYYSVGPQLNYWKLGLEPVDVILETESISSIFRLEEIATLHPYTAYRGRCYGAKNGILMQYRTPQGSRRLIQKMIKALEKEDIITAYRFLPSGKGPALYTSMNLLGWDPKSFTWRFDWNKWFKKPSRPLIWKDHSSESGSALSWLTKRDVSILSELMVNSRRKQTELISALKKVKVSITPQTLSRRLKLLQNECISGYRVSYDPAAFDIYNNAVIVGKGNSDYIHRLASRVRKYPIPFDSTLHLSDDELFWYVRLQASHMSSLLTNLYMNLNEMDVYLVDYSHAMQYYIWPETYDEDNQCWREDEEFMIDSVLNPPNE
jgi:DNA-binding Lrp family transcriptional regulator